MKNLPSNAGDLGFIPGQGAKIPHAAGQLSLHTATMEPVHSRARVPQLESPHATTTEPAHSGAHASQLESLHTATAEPAGSGTHAPQLDRSPHTTTKDPACRN